MKPPLRQRPAGRVRIIGGTLRGSRLEVPDRAGLRPTPDRVRETLFNWLQPQLPGARCIDLFAGSGALGFEAVSRGAAHALLLEREPRLAQSLRETARRLHIEEQVTVECVDALQRLREQAAVAFDIAFVDPPFGAGLTAASLAALEAGWLAADAMIYVESAAGATPGVPASWRLHREGHTREVRYALYRRNAGTLAPESRRDRNLHERGP